jgi:uncharacterized protein (DUF4415 family)
MIRFAPLAFERPTNEKEKFMKKKSRYIDPHKPLTEAEWDAMGPIMFGLEGLPEEAQKAIRNMQRGRPKKDHPKQPISFRFDASLVAHLKKNVDGYNGRVEQLLMKAFDEGRL